MGSFKSHKSIRQHDFMITSPDSRASKQSLKIMNMVAPSLATLNPCKNNNSQKIDFITILRMILQCGEKTKKKRKRTGVPAANRADRIVPSSAKRGARWSPARSEHNDWKVQHTIQEIIALPSSVSMRGAHAVYRTIRVHQSPKQAISQR